ncbi:MAG: hypothetical protein GX359_03475 [Clostridiales bacterium]|nr:hypothetical protein [Clostridiales bacterium]
MLNNRKIRLMTRLAVFESKEGKEDIRLSKYYKTDYIRYQVLKSILSTTVGYLLLLVLVFLYKSEYIIKNAVSLDYKTIGSYVLGIYIILITVYGLGSLAWFSFKYDASRKKLTRYFRLLKRMKKIYKEEMPE